MDLTFFDDLDIFNSSVGLVAVIVIPQYIHVGTVEETTQRTIDESQLGALFTGFEV